MTDMYDIPTTTCSAFGSYPNPLNLTDEDRTQFHPVVKFPSPPGVLDFTKPRPHSIELATEEQRQLVAKADPPGSLDCLPAHVQERLQAKQGKYHIGRYDEDRVGMYMSALFDDTESAIESFAGRRNVHMGIDLDGTVGTPVYAFTHGTVHAVGKNEALGDYGNVIVIAHDLPIVSKDETMEQSPRVCYALYGHLDDSVPQNFQKGDRVAAGQKLGSLGAIHENGGWFIPHVHFQLALSPPVTHDLPGAVAMADRPRALVEFPDPRSELNSSTTAGHATRKGSDFVRTTSGRRKDHTLASTHAAHRADRSMTFHNLLSWRQSMAIEERPVSNEAEGMKLLGEIPRT